MGVVSEATKRMIPQIHETSLRRVLKEQFDILMPEELSHEMKTEVKSQMWDKGIKSVTAKHPNGSHSTMMFNKAKDFVYGFIVYQCGDGRINVDTFDANKLEQFVERVGQEVFSSAKVFNG